MKYLLLCCDEEKEFDALPKREQDTLMDEMMVYAEELRKNGRLLAAEPLESVQTATTVRVRNGKMSVTDGPFAETKEQIGGFFLVEARDLNEAIQAAARMPSARLGSIEVRPVRELRGGNGTKQMQ